MAGLITKGMVNKYSNPAKYELTLEGDELGLKLDKVQREVGDAVGEAGGEVVELVVGLGVGLVIGPWNPHRLPPPRGGRYRSDTGLGRDWVRSPAAV